LLSIGLGSLGPFKIGQALKYRCYCTFYAFYNSLYIILFKKCDIFYELTILLQKVNDGHIVF
jgi:hypothetical protein